MEVRFFGRWAPQAKLQFWEHVSVAQFWVVGIVDRVLRHKRHRVISSEFMDALVVEQNAELLGRREFKELNLAAGVEIDGEAVKKPFAAIVHRFGRAESSVNFVTRHAKADGANALER